MDFNVLIFMSYYIIYVGYTFCYGIIIHIDLTL